MLYLLLFGYVFGIGLGACGGTEGAFVARDTPLFLLLGGGLALSWLLATRRPLVISFLVLWVAGGSGYLRAQRALHPRLGPCDAARHLGRDRLLVDLEVTHRARRVAAEASVQLTRALALEQHGRRRPLCGQVALWRAASAPPLAVGQRLRLRARLRPASSGRNPGREGVALRQLIEGVRARIYAEEETLVLSEGIVEASTLARVAARLRRQVEVAIPSPRARAIVLALVLGERAGIDDTQRKAFAQTGISHLLAVSGLHLALVALGVYAFTRRALIWVGPLARRYDTRRAAALAAVATALGYTLLVGAPPSALRAWVMTCVLLGGPLMGRRADLWRSLALAAWGLLLISPFALFRPAFQLSFAAVIGIGLASRRAGLKERLGRLRQWGMAGRGASFLLSLLVASWGATLATWPLASHHFGLVSLVGLVLNLVAVPLVTLLLLPLAATGALMVLVYPPVGKLLLLGAGNVASWLDALAQAVAALPGAALQLHLDWWGALALCLLGFAWLAPLRQPWRWRGGAALLAIIALAAGPVSRLVAPRLEVTFLDVGQGDSTFLRLPDGTTMLVDAGGSEHKGYDPGRLHVLPYLRARGIRRLDVVVASHPHADHVGGLGAVIDEVEVGEIWSCWPAGRPARWQRRLQKWAEKKRVPLRAPRSLHRAGVTLRPLWPPGIGSGRSPSSCGSDALSKNDNSIVLRLEYGASALLLTGDLEALGEEELAAQAPPFASRGGRRQLVLKVPHHGSAGSSSRLFLRWARPTLAVISCGRHNRFGFPRAPTLARYAELATATRRIDRRGAIGVVLWPDGGLTDKALFNPFP